MASPERRTAVPRRTALALVVALFATRAAAAPPPAVQAEIDGLLQALQASGCAFERNGDWHAADEARAHLQTKRAWLEQRGAIASAEDFIAQAGTQSSRTGRPYRVRCGDAAPVASRVWLEQQLRRLRADRRRAP